MSSKTINWLYPIPSISPVFLQKKIVSQSELESVWEVNLLADKKIKKRDEKEKAKKVSDTREFRSNKPR